MAEHNTLTGSSLHEPKGTTAASSGQVYVADGASSGAWTTLTTSTPTDSILVNALSDLPSPSAGVITLAANKQYLLGTDINLGTNRIVFSDGSTLSGIESLVTTLTYTGTSDMFTMTDTTNRVSTMTISCANGRIFNWTSTSLKILRVNDITIASCDTFGLFTGVDAILRFTNVSPGLMTTNGLSFVGSFDNFLWEVSASTVTAGALFNLGTATFASFITDLILVSVASGATFLTGASSSANIESGGLGLISRIRFSGAGTQLSGVTTEDSLWEFRGNDDLKDTRPDGLLSMQGNSTDTVIAVTGTPVLAAGTWVVERTSQFTGTTGGRLTYTGGKDATLPITIRVSLEPVSGTNKTLGVTVFKNGSEIANSLATALIDAGSPSSLTCFWQDTFSTGDYIEIYLSNETDTIDVLGSVVILRTN